MHPHTKILSKLDDFGRQDTTAAILPCKSKSLNQGNQNTKLGTKSLSPFLFQERLVYTTLATLNQRVDTMPDEWMNYIKYPSPKDPNYKSFGFSLFMLNTFLPKNVS